MTNPLATIVDALKNPRDRWLVIGAGAAVVGAWAVFRGSASSAPKYATASSSDAATVARGALPPYQADPIYRPAPWSPPPGWWPILTPAPASPVLPPAGPVIVVTPIQPGSERIIPVPPRGPAPITPIGSPHIVAGSGVAERPTGPAPNVQAIPGGFSVYRDTGVGERAGGPIEMGAVAAGNVFVGYVPGSNIALWQ